MGKNQANISRSRGGLVGLVNLGNTCFMNAGLQCLSHIEPISAYFLTGKYAEELNPSNPFGTGGHLAKGFAKLQELLWQRSSKAQTPSQIHSTLSKFARHLFRDAEQQDAQELLAYLLDGLHEDLNLVKVQAKGSPASQPVDPDEEDERLCQLEREKGEEYVAALTWMNNLMRHKSVLIDLFQGQLRSQLTCGECGHRSKTFDPYLYVSLPIHYGMRTLEDALGHFLKEEALTDDERWRCPKCKRHVDAVKKIDFWKLPPVLVIHLKRFEFDTSTCRFRKINTKIRAPLTVDFSQFVNAPQKGGSMVYDVISVANHMGNAGRGHYTATCRHPVDGRFYHFNDTDVYEAEGDDIITKEAYVLFLMRQDSTDWERQSVSNPEVWPHAVSNSMMLPAVWELTGQKPVAPPPPDDSEVQDAGYEVPGSPLANDEEEDSSPKLAAADGSQPGPFDDDPEGGVAPGKQEAE